MKFGAGRGHHMALSAGPLWSSLPRSSFVLQKRVSPILWRSAEHFKFRSSSNVQGSSNLVRPRVFYSNAKIFKRNFIVFSASGSQSPSDELINDIKSVNGLDDGDDVDDVDDIDDDDIVKGSSPSEETDTVSSSIISKDSTDEIKVNEKKFTNVYWFIGPTLLVAFLVLPSFYLRRILLMVFEDSLFTDFLILFFTEALFYGGVAIYMFITDFAHQIQDPEKNPKNYGQLKSDFGLRVVSVATLVLSLIIPLVTMGMVWPWTGPAASATLAPYLVGIVIQFAFEQYARYRKSVSCAIIPVVFQVYRLHQLNRATQLVTALSYSVRGVESTAQTVAINNSLGTLLNVLQLLGVICIWSLSSFLMRFLPASAPVPES